LPNDLNCQQRIQNGRNHWDMYPRQKTFFTSVIESSVAWLLDTSGK